MNVSNIHAPCSVKLLGGAFLGLGLVACGGGGGDSGAGGVTYTGNTNPAVITTANGAAVATNAYSGGALGSDIGGIAAAQQPSGNEAVTPRVFALYQSLHGFAQRIDVSDAAHAGIAHAQQTFTDTIPSQEACGGAVTPSGNVEVSFSYDDVTGDFSGTGQLNNYCEGGQQLSGGMTLSGKIDPITGDFISLTITVFALTAVSAGDNITVGGSVTLASVPSESLSMNLVMRDNSTQKTAWVRDFVFAVTPTSSYADLTLTGRFYEHDLGYVELSTPIPLRIFNVDDWPSAGTMIATGAGNARATLTALSNTTFRVDVDETGDGQADITVTGSWDAL